MTIENRIGRRKREKKATDMAAHLLNSSCFALHMICCNVSELSEMVGKGDFGIVVLEEGLNEKNFAEIIPMLHIRRLRKPLEIIELLISNMDEEL